MWSGECETSKYGYNTIYQRQNIYTAYIMIGVLAFIFICCIVFILIRRKQAALGGNYNHHVEMQIHQLNDQWDVMSKKTYAADSSDGTTKGG